MLHQRSHFYKYYTGSSALAVLQNSTTKWSAPRHFNDPFDMPSRMSYSFSGEEAAQELIDELVFSAFGTSPVIGDPNNKYVQLLKIFRVLPNKPPEKKFREILSSSIEEVSHAFSAYKEESNQKLKSVRNDLAVFCVTETYNNLLMWAHYAQNHTGCVFRFSCLEACNPRLHYAQKVKYVEQFPEILRRSDFVKKLLGQSGLDPTPRELTNMFLLSKSTHWSYEQEWRAIFSLEDTETGFDFHPLNSNDIDEIYIGCMADDQFVKIIYDIVENSYPHISLFKANIDVQKYSLNFERIR